MRKRIVCAIVLTMCIFALGMQSYKADGGHKESASVVSRNNAEKYFNVSDFYIESYSDSGIQKKARLIDGSQVYETGKNIMISQKEINQYQSFYLEAGMPEKDALNQAVKFAEERNAMYVEALQHGYAVTEQEIKEYLENMKNLLKNDETGYYEGCISEFASEDEYWEYQYKVYEVDLPIKNYVKELEKQFSEKSKLSLKSNKFESLWEDEFERIKEAVVKNQEFQ